MNKFSWFEWMFTVVVVAFVVMLFMDISHESVYCPAVESNTAIK